MKTGHFLVGLTVILLGLDKMGGISLLFKRPILSEAGCLFQQSAIEIIKAGKILWPIRTFAPSPKPLFPSPYSPEGAGPMNDLKFSREICDKCETIDCLARCQYMKMDLKTAKE